MSLQMYPIASKEACLSASVETPPVILATSRAITSGQWPPGSSTHATRATHCAAECQPWSCVASAWQQCAFIWARMSAGSWSQRLSLISGSISCKYTTFFSCRPACVRTAAPSLSSAMIRDRASTAAAYSVAIAFSKKSLAAVRSNWSESKQQFKKPLNK